MSDLWKLGRELARVRQQIRAVPELLTEPFYQRRHDKAVANGFPVTDGNLGRRQKVAIFLVYQPTGLAASTVETCRALCAAGYSPLLVSNAKLSDESKTDLKPHTWRIVERPNFGYDFGGYRDGVQWLFNQAPELERLVFLNDSIWFPVMSAENLLAKCEANENAISGTILRERGTVRFLESYFYSIPKHIYINPDFRAFWKNLKLTSNKYKVIRRGERGFSVAMQAAGIELAPVYPYDAFINTIANWPKAELRKSLQYAAHVYAEREAERTALLANTDDADWIGLAVEHIRSSLPREQPYSCFPYAMVRAFDYPALKKSNDRVAIGWRAAYLRAVDAADLPRPNEIVLRELRCQVNADMQ